jgi:putative membrane protein
MIADFLNVAYPWTQSLHVISVIAWMAGLFYLPRLYVYHVEQVGKTAETAKLFQTMEMKLYRLIMQPSMVASWVFGLCLVLTPGVVPWSEVWPWTKAISIVGMTWFHVWLGQRRQTLLLGTDTLTGRQYRLMNEVPTVLLVVIVVSVIARPF